MCISLIFLPSSPQLLYQDLLIFQCLTISVAICQVCFNLKLLTIEFSDLILCFATCPYIMTLVNRQVHEVGKNSLVSSVTLYRVHVAPFEKYIFSLSTASQFTYLILFPCLISSCSSTYIKIHIWSSCVPSSSICLN